MDKPFINVFPEIIVIRRKILWLPWEDINQWCSKNNIEYKFYNHWSDETGECFSFEIKDEAHRILFKLRWA